MDGNGEGVAVLELQPSSSGVSCSICLDLVLSINGGRSRAKLQCGHEFHLDCIGSAFNMKGAMQCPNCRKVEKGQWLYANGSARSFPESSMDDWNPDEDPYDLNYPEMPFRVHWCPFGELARIPTSFESGPRAGSSFVSSAVPRYPGSNVHTHEMIQVSHAFHLQQRPSSSLGMPSPIIPAVRRIDSPGGLPPVVPASLQPDGNGGFHIYPPQTPSVPNLHEAENPLPNQFHAWEREHFSRFPPVLSDMDTAWGQYHHAAGDSDSVNRSGGLWHRHWS